MIKALVSERAIEVGSAQEAALDLESVLAGYAAAAQDAAAEARELVHERGLSPGDLGRIRKFAAEKRGIKVGDEGLVYLLGQLVEMLLHSGHVEEVFAEDHELRRVMRGLLREEAEQAEAVEAEVRGKLRHVTEGSRVWEIEYERMRADIKRRRGME